MFQPTGLDGEVPFLSAIRCASATMKNKIISSEDDLIGVLLYNTVKDRNMAAFKGIYQLQKLDVPDAERIKELDKMGKSIDIFQSIIGSSQDEALMGNVFWTCSSVFGPLKKKSGSKRVFLFTNEDSPHKTNIGLQRAAKIRARDLADLGIFIELFSLSKTDHKFDLTTFYQDVLPIPVDEEEDFIQSQISESTEKFEELMAKVRRREARKRAIGRTMMTFGDGMKLAIRVYTLFIEAKKGQYVWMDESSGKLAKPVTEWIGQLTGTTLDRTQLQYYYDFGGQKAVFTKSELAAVKDLGQPGLTILGFRPKSWLKPFQNLTHSSFIFPDETEIRGSIVCFSALLKTMLEQEVVAVASYVARRTVVPKFVALIPQMESIDEETGAQVKPSGFHLIVLPFADDKRHLNFEDEFTRTEPELVDQAKDIINKLTISGGFDPEAFENPVLQRHYASLQALALDQELDEGDLKDSIIPDLVRMQKRAGHKIEEFIAMIPATPSMPQTTTAKKRQQATDGDSQSKKAVADLNVDTIAGDASKLAKLTVPVLKAYAESKGLKPAKLKSELVSQIVEYSTTK